MQTGLPLVGRIQDRQCLCIRTNEIRNVLLFACCAQLLSNLIHSQVCPPSRLTCTGLQPCKPPRPLVPQIRPWASCGQVASVIIASLVVPSMPVHVTWMQVAYLCACAQSNNDITS